MNYKDIIESDKQVLNILDKIKELKIKNIEIKESYLKKILKNKYIYKQMTKDVYYIYFEEISLLPLLRVSFKEKEITIFKQFEHLDFAIKEFKDKILKREKENLILIEKILSKNLNQIRFKIIIEVLTFKVKPFGIDLSEKHIMNAKNIYINRYNENITRINEYKDKIQLIENKFPLFLQIINDFQTDLTIIFKNEGFSIKEDVDEEFGDNLELLASFYQNC